LGHRIRDQIRLASQVDVTDVRSGDRTKREVSVCPLTAQDHTLIDRKEAGNPLRGVRRDGEHVSWEVTPLSDGQLSRGVEVVIVAWCQVEDDVVVLPPCGRREERERRGQNASLPKIEDEERERMRKREKG
jgi:hypothetical protein